jgi:hypothetical protein
VPQHASCNVRRQVGAPWLSRCRDELSAANSTQHPVQDRRQISLHYKAALKDTPQTALTECAICSPMVLGALSSRRQFSTPASSIEEWAICSQRTQRTPQHRNQDGAPQANADKEAKLAAAELRSTLQHAPDWRTANNAAGEQALCSPLVRSAAATSAPGWRAATAARDGVTDNVIYTALAGSHIARAINLIVGEINECTLYSGFLVVGGVYSGLLSLTGIYELELEARPKHWCCHCVTL